MTDGRRIPRCDCARCRADILVRKPDAYRITLHNLTSGETVAFEIGCQLILQCRLTALMVQFPSVEAREPMRLDEDGRAIEVYEMLLRG